MKTTLFLLAYGLGCGALALSVRGEFAGPRVERIFMPYDASPSSFAIGLPGGVNFCFDPVRAAVSYVWLGEFVDLTPARPGIGKFIEPVELLGAMAYRESGAAPLRPGDPARIPSVRFQGYTLEEDAVEFRYTVEGRAVRERIALRGSTLVRRWYVKDGKTTRWWYVTDGAEPIELSQEGGALVQAIPLQSPAP